MTTFKAGDKIKPVHDGGSYSWYPYITVLGKGNHGLLHVRFNDGRESRGFDPNGWMAFVKINERIKENE